MYERYIQEYKTHEAKYGPLTAIFMQVGSFYELYDIPDPNTGQPQTSMRRAVDTLGIALKVKKGDGPRGQDGWFAGFPDTQLHKFAALLTRENWTVVVIDQVKDGAGRVDKRQVARILSPGTHLEAATGDSAYLAGLWLELPSWTESALAAVAPPKFAAVAIDLSTGSTTFYEGSATGRKDTWTSDDLLHFFAVHPPRELIIWWRGAALDMPSEQTLRRNLGVPTGLLHVKGGLPAEQGGLEKPLVREDLLRRCYQPKTMLPLREALGLEADGCSLAERALASTLLFVEDHFPAAMEHLHAPHAWTPREAVVLGNHALTQLNMITPREEDSVLGLFSRTLTPMGRRGLRRRLLYPLCCPEKLERRYEEIAWWLGAPTAGATDLLRQMSDLARMHRKITTATVAPSDILLLDQTYTCSKRMATALAATPLQIPATLEEFPQYLAAFARVFDTKKALAACEDAFCLTEEAGPKCSAIEQQIAATHAKMGEIRSALAEWLGESEESLRLEIKDSLVQVSAAKGLITRAQERLKRARSPPEILAGLQIHARKAGGSIEIPALTALFHGLARLRESLAAAVRTELEPVCDGLADQYADLWDALEEWITHVDVTGALARVASERGYCRPRISSAAAAAGPAGLKAVGLRHPLIENQATRVEYVRHDVCLGVEGSAEGWLVYGMNASGKSSLMKSVGIAVVLAQCGCFVPASSFEFVPFRGLYTRILNTDNLWAGLSSFAVEMSELREILVRADERSLVLGDEVCSGTESVSATALVASTLESFSRRGVRYMFATHLHDLQKLAVIRELPGLKVWHLRVRYDAAGDRLIYERTLHPGPGNTLYGLEVAKAMAIPHGVLERAHSIRRELLGTATEEEAPASSWNAAVQRRACEVCANQIVRDLEVHHIRPRAGGGDRMNVLENLVVVCQVCHDAHHAGEIKIGGVQMTSEGPKREIERVAPGPPTPESKKSTHRAGGLSDEKIQIVKSYLSTYPKAAPSTLVWSLKENEGIDITAARLRSIRLSMQ
jgi:DNA mismatch repair protein MutS